MGRGDKVDLEGSDLERIKSGKPEERGQQRAEVPARAHFRKARTRAPIGEGMLKEIDALPPAAVSPTPRLSQETKASGDEKIRESIASHISTGAKIEDADLAASFREYLQSYNTPSQNKPDFKGFRVETVDDLKNQFKDSPDFEGSEDEREKAFTDFIAQDFIDWEKHIEEVEKEKSTLPVETTQPAGQDIIKMGGQEAEANIKICHLKLNEKKLSKYTDGIPEAEEIKMEVYKFYNAFRSGNVLRVGFNIKSEGGREYISAIGLAVIGKDGQETKYILSREIFCAVFDNAFPFQKREGESSSGPVIGIGFFYGPKDFQFIVPSTSDNMAQGVLQRLRLNNEGLSGGSKEPTFKVVFTRS